MNAVDTFRSKSSGIVARLLGDFPIRHDDAFAIVGNGPGHESNGTTDLQEIAPTVKGSRGGWGWFQWTGPRRRAFEAYCKRNRLDPASDEANYRWLFLELKGTEAKALPPTLAADTLDNKVVAFEESFLRAGVKHYASRRQWALIAKKQWAVDGQEPAPMPAERKKAILVDEADAIEKRASSDFGNATRNGTGGGVATTAGGLAHGNGVPWADLLLFGLGITMIGVAVWLILRARNGAHASARLHFEANKAGAS